MADDKNLLRPDYSADPQRYRELKNGSIYDMERGRIVSGAITTRITSDNARAMVERRKQRFVISKLRGLAGAIKELPPDADLETITEGAADVVEALSRHFARTFLKSSNLRGMAESYAKLIAPLVGDDEEQETDAAPKIPARVVLILAELARKRDGAEVIDISTDPAE